MYGVCFVKYYIVLINNRVFHFNCLVVDVEASFVFPIDPIRSDFYGGGTRYTTNSGKQIRF